MNSLVLHPSTATQLAELQKNPPHALIISGPTGAGKTAVAKQLSAGLLGTNEAVILASPAFLQVAVHNDEAFGIDVIRELIHFMSLRQLGASGAISRIAFVAEADSMTPQAQNALLKLLEEPPEGSMLVLATASEQNLLATIVSRCQLLTVRRPATAQLTEYLIKDGYQKKAVDQAMRISGGWPGLATALLDNSQEHPLAIAAETARNLLSQSQFERLTQIDGLARQQQLCLDTCYILGQMARFALQTSPTHTSRWQKVLQASYACQEALAGRVNHKLALTRLMLTL